MKKILILIAFISLIGCEEHKNEQSASIENHLSKNEKPVFEKSNDDEHTLLCKINGRNWSYSKASGIITENKRTGEKLATVTFKKRIGKKTESIQLYYDARNLNLKNISISLYVEQNKFAGMKGGMTRTDYELFSTDEKLPSEVLTGIVDISDSNVLSGSAKAVVVYNNKRLIKNESDVTLNISELKFNNVKYADTTKPLGF